MSWLSKLKQFLGGGKSEENKPQPSGDRVRGRIEPRFEESKREIWNKEHSQNKEKNKSRDMISTSSSAEPEAREIYGWQTQYSDIDEGAIKTDLIVGLDFGTAFTKVVVGRGDEKYAVPINPGAQNSDKYLLPTQLCVTLDGRCTIDVKPGGKDCYSDLKMRILKGELDKQSRAHVAAYLALVFQRIRGWVLKDKEPLLRNNEIKWEVNIGLPTDKYNDDNLKKLYKNLVGDAWFASTCPDGINLNRVVKEKNDKGDKIRGINPARVEAFPEFVAQVVGYISSQQRRSGVHVLVDVGAGTIDSTVFNVHRKDDENRHPIFAQSVKNLGTNFLIRHRCEGNEQCSSLLGNPGTAVPSFEKFCDWLNISSEELKVNDRPFRRQVYDQTNDLVRYTKDQKCPIQSQWETGVPVMLCGGGARVDFYQSVIDSLTDPNYGHHLFEYSLPKPENLDSPGLLINDIDRMSVAYGLASEAFGIGDVVLVEEESGIDRSNTVPRLQPCPKCSGGTRGLHGMCDRCGGSGFVN